MAFDMKAWCQSPEGRASQKRSRARYKKTARGQAAIKRADEKHRQTERRQEYMVRYGRKRFLEFKKALAPRIDCLRHTAPAFREARIQEILDWAGNRHLYWVENEIQNAC